MPSLARVTPGRVPASRARATGIRVREENLPVPDRIVDFVIRKYLSGTKTERPRVSSPLIAATFGLSQAVTRALLVKLVTGGRLKIVDDRGLPTIIPA